MNLFSKRGKPKLDKFRYDLPVKARNRILHHFDVLHRGGSGYVAAGNAYDMMLDDVYDMCMLEYGGLCKTPSEWGVHGLRRHQYASVHFAECNDEHAIDFIEMCFRSPNYMAGQQGVHAVNDVLRDEGIGFEFSSFVQREIELGPNDHRIGLGIPGQGSYRIEITYPQATKKTDELLHATAVMPALSVLADPRFKTANEEMLRAHKHLKDGSAEESITAACQAFESVFKTICTHKKWPFDKDKDTLSKLVEICRDKKLFEPFYTEIFKNVGTIRNRMGGHGGGPDAVKPNLEHAENMVHLVSSHTLLLVKIAKL